jgi:hypothetical protein
MDQCTENYECLVIDNNVKSNKLSEQIFWYKANLDIRNDFKLGSKEFWEMSKSIADEEEDPPYNPEQYRKTAQKINVKKTKW